MACALALALRGAPAWVAIACQLLAVISAALAVLLGASADSAGTLPAPAWFVAVQALIVLASLLVHPPDDPQSSTSRAILCLGQSAAAAALLANDVRLIAAGLTLAVLATPAALLQAGCREARSPTTGAGSLFTPASLGGLFVVLGLLLATYGDAAIRARQARGAAEMRWDLPAIQAALIEATTASGARAGIWKQLAPWTGASLVAGFVLLGGCVPFHRAASQALREAPAELRVPVIAAMAIPTWGLAVRLEPGLMSPLLASAEFLGPLMLLTVWLAALLILSRVDLSRLVASAALMLTGVTGAAFLATRGVGVSSAGLLVAGWTPALAAVGLLLTWLERAAGSREFSEFGGLLRSHPRFAAALIVCVLWICGLPMLSAYPGLWLLWAARAQTTNVDGTELLSLWPVLMPLAIGVWGWLRTVDALLLSVPRLPEMPDVLRERTDRPWAPVATRDLNVRELAAIGLLAAWGLLLTAWPGFLTG
ncbi:MAG: hypothetical protein KF774_15600 [Planctomyces sp.]|nr:hypothetical protein [Planctomyces sp.]